MASFWSTLVAMIACVLAVDATRITHKHARFSWQKAPTDIAKRATGKTQFGYFTPWGDLSEYNYVRPWYTYILRYVDVWIFTEPTDIVSTTLTHILYAFADIDGSTGIPKFTDPSSDIENLKQVGPTTSQEVSRPTHYSGFSCTDSSRSNETSKSFSALVEAFTPGKDVLPL